MELPFQNRPHWPPKYACCFHCHMRDSALLQPICHRHQRRRHRGEAANLLFLLPVVVKPQSACRDALLVYVQTRTSFIQYSHDSSWLRQKETYLLLNSPSRARLLRQRQFVVLNGFRIRLHRGLKGTTESAISFPAQRSYITAARPIFILRCGRPRPCPTASQIRNPKS